jgi:quercetin dioxygenase-like cupin family protein
MEMDHRPGATLSQHGDGTHRQSKEEYMEVKAKPDTRLNQLVRSRAIEWQPLDEQGVSGVCVKVLRVDAEAGRAPTILLKFEPGASYPAHRHPGGEEIFVLEGDIRLGKDRLLAGDYLYTAPGNTHGVQSDEGCVVLVSVPQEVEKLPPRVPAPPDQPPR